MSLKARKFLNIYFVLILAILAGMFGALPTRVEAGEAISSLNMTMTVGNWSALGSTPAGTDGALSHPSYATVFDIVASGTDVYVGGCFVNAGGDPTADYVAKWDTLTGTWSGLGNDGAATPDGALKGCVALGALAVDGTDVYVGGFPNTWIGGAPAPQAKYLAKWDALTGSWSGLGHDGAGGSSLNSVVNTIAINGNDVYVGGNFTDVKNGTITLTEADYIAKWDSQTENWSALGNNGMGNGALSGRVETILVVNSEVYVGGRFIDVFNGLNEIPEATYLAKWDGAQWSAVGSSGDAYHGGPILNTVYALATDGTNLYAAGSFENVNNYGTILTAADHIAKWDTLTGNWSALGNNGSGDGALNEAPIAILIHGTDIYVGGGFTDVNNNGTVLTAADYVAKWDALTGNWSALGSNGSGNGSLNTYVYSSLGLAGNKLYVGGEFTNVNNNGTVLNTADYIAAYTIDHAIYRVAPEGASTPLCGSSWSSPCDLQYALNTLSSAGDELWVKAGTYKPTTDTDRMIPFALKNGVAIYGGFAGTETLRTQRDPSTNVTILSGEIGATGFADNSYHVVVGSGTDNTAVLDGFMITAGNADDIDIDYGGGSGMFISSGNPTLTNLVFNENTALNGGGLFNEDSDPTVTHVTFSSNLAVLGGGMYNYLNSNPTLVDVTFSGNYTTTSSPGAGSGGGMHNQYSSPDLTNVTFSNNTAAVVGGGMFNYQSSPTLTNVTFSNNSAYMGGGLYNQVSSPSLTNVTFSGNSTSYPNGTNPFGGGGMHNQSSNPTLKNVIIANSVSGGDCLNTSSTLNAASTNNLIEDAVNACGLTNGVNGNIIGSDPNLGPLANNGGLTETHALLVGSPAIDAGDDGNCPATDQRGVSRPQGSSCDIGAYESQDLTPPTVLSITRVGTTPTLATSVDFTVTFSEAVTGVNVGDFALTTTGLTGTSITNVSGSGDTYIVAVNTGSGSGTIRLDVVDDDSIQDAAFNPLGGTGTGNGNFTSGEFYTVPEIVSLSLNSIAANDGWVLESGENSNIGGTLNSTANTFHVGDDKANRQSVGVLHFDTSSLPDAAVITSVILRIQKQALEGTDPFSTHGDLLVDIQNPYFGTTAALTVDDFQATAGQSAVSTFDPNPVNNWYSATVDGAGYIYIDLIGTTQFRLRFSLDDNNDRRADFMKFYSGDAAAANQPQLVIQYYIP